MIVCKCDKCDGGKVVSRVTWFRHKKRVRTSRENPHPGSQLQARRNLLPDVVSNPSDMDIDVSEVEDAPDGDSRVTLSDVVSVILSILYLLSMREDVRDAAILYICPKLPLLALHLPHLVPHPPLLLPYPILLAPGLPLFHWMLTGMIPGTTLDVLHQFGANIRLLPKRR